jgi:hypothetical protein
MAIYQFAATIAPGQTHYWWTNAYNNTDKPQLDAYPLWTFPEGITYTGAGARLWYGDFACKLMPNDVGALEYYVTVRNDGTETCLYNMRVWVP